MMTEKKKTAKKTTPTRTILLIDDDRDMHNFSKVILEKMGYRLLSAYDGPQGLDMIVSQKPDVVLLDYMMPGMNGCQFFEELTTHEKYAHCQEIPVIMLTALEQPLETKNKLLEMGLAAYLNKPFRHKELINVIENILLTNRIHIRQKQLTQAIKDAKDFLENLIESSPDAIITTDREGQITFFSKGAEEIFAYQAEEMLGKPLEAFCLENNSKPRITDRLEEKGIITNLEMKFLSKERGYIPVSFSFSLLKDKNNQYIGNLAIGKDLSEIKKLEKALVEKERLAAIMEATVAINHEINNPLTAILGNVQLMLANKEKLDQRIVTKLEIIEKNVWRIHQIVQKLNCITQPTKVKYFGDTDMLDIESSV